MQLIKLTDSQLVALTKSRVATERQSTLDVIECLREIFRRRVHLTLSYPSLHVFCVKELGFSDSEAYTRLDALKLLEEVPTTRKALKDGTLSLTKAAQIQSFFERQKKRNAPLEASAKEQIIDTLKDKSQREVQLELVTIGLELGDTQFAHRESTRPVGANVTEVKLYVSDELIQKLERLRSLLSHKIPIGTDVGAYASLLEVIAEIALEKIDPVRKSPRAPKPRRDAPGSPRRKTEKSRYIPQEVRRKVWAEAQGMCQFRGARLCGSKYKLQIEHKVPWSMGGSNEIENLTLLCAAHNMHQAKEVFGKIKIESHYK